MTSVRESQGGFTLIELLVATAIFSVLATMIYGALEHSLKMRDEVAVRNEARNDLMFSLLTLERDLLQMAPRPVIDELGETRAALVLENVPAPRLEFTRTGLRNPLRQARPALRRVAYVLEGDRLVRRTWNVLDRGAQTRALDEVLLEGIEFLEFSALGSGWSPDWPAASSDPVPAAAPVKTMPRAVRVSIKGRETGEIVRLVPGTG
ncbi:MAG: type II secretion system minor pseudopilin GspJ [Pseudomonadota bacterium]